MREMTQFGDFEIEIWRRPRQRHMHLTVRPDGRLRVTCNRTCPKREVFAFVDRSGDFIQRRLTEIDEFQSKFPPKTYLSGEQFLYFGERVRLDVIWSWSSAFYVQRTESAIEMVAPLYSQPVERRHALDDFYKQTGRVYLKRRLHELSELTGLVPSALTIRGQTSRWGSCTARRKINLNWKLIAAPAEVIDYVIVHELAHLEHMNHSPRFWNLVAQHFPRYREAKEWLRRMEPEIAHQFPRE